MPRSKGKGSLKLSCNSHDCDNNKHCFKPGRRTEEPGGCVSCGLELVDFPRVQLRQIADLDYTIDALKKEMIRDVFWRREFNQHSIDYARRKGMLELRRYAAHKVVVNIGDAADAFDGRRVPVDEEKMANPYQYAFHATATCCRKCVEYWHGIPRERSLTAEEINYLSGLVDAFLVRRLQGLPTEGVKVPPRRRFHP